MRAYRVYGRGSVTIIGVMMVAALFPYLCRGAMPTPQHLSDAATHDGVVSPSPTAPGASLVATEHGADRCAAYNSCCSTPAKQKSRYSPEALAPCAQIDIVPVPPAATSVAVVDTTAEGLPAFPPGTSAPLIC